MPYFSLVMPTKNRAYLIKKAIDSIINQTNNNWELLVIDDHSTDNTEQVINSFGNPNIKYFKLEGGTGPAFARDFAIRKLAKGEVIVITDSDDINYPDRLQLIHEYLQKNPRLDIVYGGSEVLKENGDIYPQPTSVFKKELLKKYNFIVNPAASYKRESYLKTSGYDTRLRTSEDYDLWLTFLGKDYKFGFIDKALVLRVLHKNRTTNMIDYLKRKRNLAYVRKKHHLPLPAPKEVKQIVSKELWNYISAQKGLNFWFNVPLKPIQ
jgi:glycosyltransferase involved in cell wall biosynthesis